MRGWLWSAALALALAAGPAGAKTFRFANDSDVRSLDPYAGQRFVPAQLRRQHLRTAGAARQGSGARAGAGAELDRRPRRIGGASPCAMRCCSRTARNSAPTTWCSRSRGRARPARKLAWLLAQVKEVRALDDRTVELVTNGPDPLLPDELSRMADHEPRLVRGA